MTKRTKFIAVKSITVVDTPCYRVLELKPAGAEFRIIGKNGKFVCVGKLESVVEPMINQLLFSSGKGILKEWFTSPPYQETYVKRAKKGAQDPHTTWNKIIDYYIRKKIFHHQYLNELKSTL